MALVVALFVPVFQNGFVYDDDTVIERGDLIYEPSRALELFAHPTMHASPKQRDKTRAVDTYRPLSMLTFFWDAQLSGRKPWSYHLTNLLAHLLALTVVFRLARRLLSDERWAWVAAAWFTLTPLPQAAHIWINGRSDVLCTIFGGAAVLLFLRARDAASEAAKVWSMVGACASFFAALLCKEVWLGALPAMFFLPTRDAAPTRPLARLRAGSGFLLASAVYLVLRHYALGGVRAHETQSGALLAIARLPLLWLDAAFETLLPTRVYLRCLYYDYRDLPPALLVLAWLTVLAGAGALWRARRRFPLQLWGALWFAGTLAPVAMISTMIWPGFGRYLYVPAVGLVLSATDLVARLWQAKPQARRVLGALAVLYGLVLVTRLELWIADYRGGETLFQAIIRADPRSPHGYGWLGFWRHNHGDFAAAIAPLENAYQRHPDGPYLEALANAYMQTGRAQEAFGAALTGLKSTPLASYYMILVNVTHLQRPDVAARHVADCLLYNPGQRDCTRVYHDMNHAHPRASEYRALFAEIFAEPRYAALRAALSVGQRPAERAPR